MLRALAVVCLLATSAHGEPWYRGKHGTNRILHVSLTTVGFVTYLPARPLEERLAADVCRWCEPTAVDTATRDALRWRDGKDAALASDITSYGVTPLLSLGLVALGTLAEPSWAAAIDDFTPIIESMVVAQWVTRALKLAIGRQRPYAHYTGPGNHEDNLSMPSGHTSRAFSLVVSAAVVARARRYKSEPYIWALGLTVASASAYLRITADRHYLTDVLAGAALGTLAGLTVPSLMWRSEITIVPARDGIAVAGAW